MNSNFDYTSFSAETAGKLRDHAQQITTRLKRAKEDTHAIAESLADAQKLLSTTQFDGWCTSELNITGRHARRLIRTAQFFTDGIPANMSQTIAGMLASETTPEEVREEVLADAAVGKKTSVQELNEKTAAHKAAAESGKPAQGVQPAPAPMKAANTNASLTGSVAHAQNGPVNFGNAMKPAQAVRQALTSQIKVRTEKQAKQDKSDAEELAKLLRARLSDDEFKFAMDTLNRAGVVEYDTAVFGRPIVRAMEAANREAEKVKVDAMHAADLADAKARMAPGDYAAFAERLAVGRAELAEQAALVAEIEEDEKVDEFAFTETNVMNVAA